MSLRCHSETSYITLPFPSHPLPPSRPFFPFSLIVLSTSASMVLGLSILLVAFFPCDLLSPALAVSVTLYSPSLMHDEWLTCPSLLPGQCCLEPSNPLPYPYWQFHRISSQVNFTALLPNHIAAVWESKPRSRSLPGWPAGGCSGRVADSRTGPGDWNWRSPRRTLGTNEGALPEGSDPIEIDRSWATGASYIEMPTALPPDGKTVSWLEGTC